MKIKYIVVHNVNFCCFRRALSPTELQEEGTLSFGGHVHSRLRFEERAS